MTKSLLDSVADSTSHRDRDRFHRSIAALIGQYLETDSVCLYRLVDDGGVARLMRETDNLEGDPQPQTGITLDPTKHLALSEVPEWETSVREHRLVQYSQAAGKACAALPIESEREVVGLLVVECAKQLQTRDLEFVGAMLRFIKNHLALLDYGERDTLTGLLNRKTFETTFEKVRHRLRRAPGNSPAEPSWLGLIDIDKFKAINDTYGHLFGDEVLLLVAQIMRRSFRGADQIFRFGGEEFVIVLDHASNAGAEIAFDRLRATIEEFTFPQVGRVTISLGYSEIFPKDDPTTCVERADAALYYAKHHGRNNIRNYEALVRAGELVAKSEGEEAELF
ncbi:MAG: sensor domain-containing diguanylate cyclase [Pseudomonadota bacterium]|nr:sensor domain-containing diguanylate cyclase [Pseudomonadota bacterium]